MVGGSGRNCNARARLRMPEDRHSMRWSVAFALQAKADLDARDWLLRNRQLPRCHELHFLQMACEKICKAHLMARPGADPLALQQSHAYITKNLPLIARQSLARQSGRNERRSHVIESIRALAVQIERLAPANDAGGTAPSNCGQNCGPCTAPVRAGVAV